MGFLLCWLTKRSLLWSLSNLGPPEFPLFIAFEWDVVEQHYLKLTPACRFLDLSHKTYFDFKFTTDYIAYAGIQPVPVKYGRLRI